MNEADPPLRTMPFPKARNIVVDWMEQAGRRHHVSGFGEIDVTVPTRLLAEHHERTGERLSLTAYVIHCLAIAVAEHPQVQAIKVGRWLHVFKDVDVLTLVERDLPTGQKVPTNYIVRRANTKRYREIHAELRTAQQAPVDGISLGSSREARLANLFARMPRFLRRIVWWRIQHDPMLRRQLIGTVHVTSVGMFVDTGGWALTHSNSSLALFVGGLVQRPQIVAGEIEARDMLAVTLSVDHDVIDGAPAARFAQRFASLLRSGEGIEAR